MTHARIPRRRILHTLGAGGAALGQVSWLFADERRQAATRAAGPAAPGAAWPVLRQYDRDHLQRVAMPLGGIGTGTVSLGGRGDLGIIVWAWYFTFMPRIAPPVTLAQTDRLELERWVAAHSTPQQVSQRCQIVLAAAGGQQDKLIADDLDLNVKPVALWRKRFVGEGPDCLWVVAEGRGRKPVLRAEEIEKIVDATLQTKPTGATHWSCRTMAKAQGVSKATVKRI